MHSPRGQTHYELLGVAETATCGEIRRAYLQKALKHHPDKSNTEQATLLFQQIRGSYEVLSCARSRFIYDAGSRSLPATEEARRRAEQERDSRRLLAKDRLMQACKIGDTLQALKLVRSGTTADDLNAVDDAGQTALMYAAQSRCAQVVSLLVLYGADVQAKNLDGWTSAMFVFGSVLDQCESQSGDAASCLLTLLRGKADANAQTASGVTPLMLACASGGVSMVQVLLEHAADPNICNTGASPLLLAADGGHATLARALLDAMAIVDLPDNMGKTALMSGAARGRQDVVGLLLTAGANPCARALDGSTPLLSVFEHFEDKCTVSPGDGSKKLDAASIASMLVGASADPDAAADDGRTPFQLAVQLDQDLLVSLFLRSNGGLSHPGSDCKRNMANLLESDCSTLEPESDCSFQYDSVASPPGH